MPCQDCVQLREQIAALRKQVKDLQSQMAAATALAREAMEFIKTGQVPLPKLEAGLGSWEG